ncbi:MAG TPA: zf-HC2 domain-containing protein, partial [Gemmatimonadaceae bacterium]
MTDCANVEMRDLLPDLVHERLGSAEVARVQAHVSECAECTAELELIRAVMASAPAAPTMDVATIVAALPQPGARTEPTMQPSIARDGRVLRFGVRQLPLAAALALAASLTFVIVRRENTQSEIRPPVAVQAPVRPSTVTAPAKTVPGTTIV